MYKNLVLVDGEIMPAEEAAVSVHDRGHQFGDGVPLRFQPACAV